MVAEITYREITSAQLPDFIDRGYRQRQFFPHKTFTIPKCGPDAFELSANMVGHNAAEAYWVIALHATGDVLRRFPSDLFFDDDVVWHRQHYGQPGHIAYAVFITCGTSLYGLNYVSDIVQRQNRAQTYRSQIQSRFNGWPHMLLNALMGFAIEHKIETVFSPTANLVMRNTDRKRTVQPELFGRVHDAAVVNFFSAQKTGEWWTIDVGENKDRAITPVLETEPLPSGKSICLTHDIERGLGNIYTDLELARSVDRESRQHLDRMLAEERRLGVAATYNVVGCIYDEVKEKIATDGHCLAFHSYDHRQFSDTSRTLPSESARGDTQSIEFIEPGLHGFAPGEQQLTQCRNVDYRTRGYRVPNSRLTPELTPQRLLRRNYDWLANSGPSVETTLPLYRDNIVYIPIMFDDFPLHTAAMDYQTWENWALDRIRQRDFVAFGLHDCYGAYWLDEYAQFLEKVAALGTLRTCDQVADDVVLAHCV